MIHGGYEADSISRIAFFAHTGGKTYIPVDPFIQFIRSVLDLQELAIYQGTGRPEDTAFLAGDIRDILVP